MTASLSVFAAGSDAAPSSWPATNAEALSATPARILLIVLAAVGAGAR